MIREIKKWGILLLLLIGMGVQAQVKHYAYRRELKGVSDLWHRVVLPEDLFQKISPSLGDLRIVGITPKKDTIEAPYIIRKQKEDTFYEDIAFEEINRTRNGKGYYFTFEITGEESVNQLKLDLKKANFDWKVDLQGSFDQREWFSILEKYRILSIKNKFTDYRFSTLRFPPVKYRYLRLLVRSRSNPELVSAHLLRQVKKVGQMKSYSPLKIEKEEDSRQKMTRLEVTLKNKVPLSKIGIRVKDSLDYYRPVRISYLADSVKRGDGMEYSFRSVSRGYLSSLGENEFPLDEVWTRKLRIEIRNFDNQPLSLDSVHVEGAVHELVARFSVPGRYFLYYGNKRAVSPNYDISRFLKHIPEMPDKVIFGPEETLLRPLDAPQPFFLNRRWLWVIMALVVLVLGWFSLKMMREQK